MKKEIEFDFAKWGQEGISVETNGTPVITLHVNPHCNSYFYGMLGPTYMFNNAISTFKMFEEVKPREFWVNEYEDGSFGQAWLDKEEADKSRIGGIDGVAKLIKLVEVID